MAKQIPLQQKVESFVKAQLSEARSALTAVESSAGKVAEIIHPQALLQRMPQAVKSLEWDTAPLKSALSGVRKRVESLQAAALEITGVATREQMKSVTRDLAKLSKKVDALLGSRVGKA